MNTFDWIAIGYLLGIAFTYGLVTAIGEACRKRDIEWNVAGGCAMTTIWPFFLVMFAAYLIGLFLLKLLGSKDDAEAVQAKARKAWGLPKDPPPAPPEKTDSDA